MISCLICLNPMETSNESAVCISLCGHVFHHPCILRWFQMNVMKTCPKCRCDVKDSNQLIKLFFGTTENPEELNSEIDSLLDENEICRKNMEYLLQEMNKNMKMIEENAKKITENREEMVHSKENSDTGTFRLKNLAVLLSRTDETRRIQAYYDSLNN